MWRMNSRLREFIAYKNQFTGVSSEKSPNTSTTWKRIYCMQFLNYDTCVCVVSSCYWKFFIYTEWRTVVHSLIKATTPCLKWSLTRDWKQWKTIKPSAQKWSRSFTRTLIIKLCLGNCSVLGLWSRMEVGVMEVRMYNEIKTNHFYSETPIWRITFFLL